ncbi:MAG TPA: DNA/RNA helicase, partial [Thermoanaerobaculia bacterium]|nr:DNA/RNA helicase [Thermoanaerobaculia bacterium]
MANTPEEIREQIVRALEADLVGPFDPKSGEEVLPLPPSRWYLTGFLVPQGSREIQEDPTAEDELGREGVTDDEEPGDGERPSEPKQKKRLPASMGLSVLLPPRPPDSPSDTVRVTVSWAEYTPEERPSEDGKESKIFWRRAPRTASVLVPLDPARIAAGVPLTTDGVDLAGKLETVSLPGAGTRNLALFVVNSRKPESGRQDERSLFQVAMEIAHEGGILPRANRSDGASTDGDTRIADLQYRNRFEYAVGHGVSVATSATSTTSAPPEGAGATVPKVRTAWIPCSEVPGVTTRVVPEVTTGMEELAALADSADGTGGKPLAQALAALPLRYGEWIAGQRAIAVDTLAREATREKLMDEADRARQRIADGIQLLEDDSEVRRAFHLANRAMAAAARARNPERYEDGTVPSWHLFQLAFVLLNLPGLADDRREDRDDVELIFFPTGGGKTEAYLGVIACALLLRRLRGRERPDGGLGVAVLLRYTLRLLTLDQLGRAATLICALEELRRADPARLGEVRFAVGLWVGRT